MNKREVYYLLSKASPVKIFIEHFTWDKWDKPYVYMDGNGDICKGNGVYFDFNSAPYDSYEIYKPKRKVKKWLWVYKTRGAKEFITTGFYATEEEAREHIHGITIYIQKLLYTEIEVEEEKL